MALNEETARLIERMGASAREIADRVQSVSGTGSDDDAMVTATCGPGNRLIDIEFDPRSRRLDTHVLKEKVLAAVQRAGDEAQRQLTAAVSDFSASFDGLRGDEMTDLRRTMADAQGAIAEQQQRLEAMYASLRSTQ